ncbi:MAG: hypothetical protein ACK5ML_08895 [Lachnospiraceae bacterium]
MKKIAALLLCTALAVGALAGCGSSSTTTSETTTSEAATEAATEAVVETESAAAETETAATETAGGAAKTGFATINSISKSTSATADAEGLAEVDTLAAAVLLDADGKIVACEIDSIQSKANFSAEGVITSDITAEVQSKNELGDAYGMKGSSAIGKEWFEQAEAFAQYVVGKTADEVAGIAINEEGYAGDEDLIASVTVHIGDFVAVVQKAATNAKELGASSTDMLGMAATTSLSGSKDAAADAEGLVQAYSYYSVVTTNADGVITSCYSDASQGKVNFDTAGAVTSDLAVAPQTKQELGDAYGMKAKSAIGKEWYEEADAFSAYCVGKTLDEVKGIAVDAEGLATDADLVSSVTVHVTDLINTVAKAVENAK